ncbi:twin-arginine translocase TatA/TatE family subunit [Neobacillus sp. NPDC093182]|uniref:twin-arginine translocase TatA/TatE family subunit n=1 Tax=Neobacillus sp. NPDC093182 TaxID=3364297 RepID=UPI00381D7B4B
MANIGVPGLIIILVLALLVFGPNKLPQLGRAVGTTLSEFRRSTQDVINEVTEPLKDEKDVAQEKDGKNTLVNMVKKN